MDMVTPSINTLLDKVGSRYALVVLAAKRARVLQENHRRIEDAHKQGNSIRQISEEKDITKIDERIRSKKDVSNALAEIAGGLITYRCQQGQQL